MDTKEHVAAGNALVQWFNSQEIAPADAKAIMSKVLAKLLVAEIGHTATRQQIEAVFDRFDLQLVHDINDRLFNVKRR